MNAPPDISQAPFTWACAQARGWSRAQLERWIADGTVRRVLHNAYDVADAPDTVDRRAAALALVAAPGVVVTDRTAAWIHGIDVLDHRELEIGPRVDCFVLRDHHRVERPECRGGERDLSARDICVVNGLRVTTPLRTAMDLGCMRPRGRALAVLDAFMRAYALTRADLEAELPRFRGRRGVVQLRALVPLADPRSESPGESMTRLAILDDGIPAPQPQLWVVHQGVELYRIDLAWPRSKVAVEYDGEWHQATPEQRRADRDRRRWLADHGWTVIVVTKESLSPSAKDAWLRELRDALRLR